MEFPNIFRRREAPVIERPYTRARTRIQSRLEARRNDERNKELLALAAVGVGALGIAGMFVSAENSYIDSMAEAQAIRESDARVATEEATLHSSDAPPAVTVAHAEAE